MIIDLPRQPRITLPDVLIGNLTTVHKAAVQPWLETVPALLHDLLNDLEASLLPCLPELSFHVVVFARSRRLGDIVIKCTVPNVEFSLESAATIALADHGGPRVWAHDADRGYIVLERIFPGVPVDGAMPTLASDIAITELMAGLALRVAATTIGEEARAATPHLRPWARALEEVAPTNAIWKLHAAEISEAVRLRDAWLDDGGSPEVFLHGDLHHANVLRNDSDGWTVIDTKGVIGPAAFDFGAFAYNPLGVSEHPDLPALLRQRIEIWSRVTGIPDSELQAWAFIAAVLSACWSAEDDGNTWHGAMRIARTFQQLGPLRPPPQ